MPSNIELNAGSGGADLATKQIAHDGDTVQLQSVSLMGISGSEDSYTVADIGGSAANGLEVDVTRVQGTVTVDASGSTVPVSNAGLTELAAAINASRVDVNLAAQAADITVADGGNSLTVDNGGTFAVQVDGAALTALQLIDNIVQAEDAVHGTGDSGVMALAVRQDTQTDFGADGDYVPLSINADGELRVTSSGGGGGGTEYTEDAAAAANPVGGVTILVRDDTPGTQVSADGDNVAQRGTNYGAAFVQVVDSSGNFIDSFGGSGGTAAADDADFTAGTTQATPVMGVYQSTPTNVTDGDMGIPGISQDRRLLVDAQIAGQDADVTIADGGNSITVDGTVTANLSATDNAVLDTIETNTDYGTVTGGGTEAGALRVTIANNSTGVVSIDDNGGAISIDDGGNVISVDDGGGALTVDNGGTFAVQVDGAALTALQLLDNIVQTQDSVAGATDSGVGLMAIRDDETASVGADGDYVNLRADDRGLLRVTEMESNTSNVQYAVIDEATSGNNTLVAAAGAGIRIRVLSLFYMAAGTVNVRFESGAGGTALSGQMEHTAQSGMVLPYNPRGWFETADNALLNMELSAAVSVDGALTYVTID